MKTNIYVIQGTEVLVHQEYRQDLRVPIFQTDEFIYHKDKEYKIDRIVHKITSIHIVYYHVHAEEFSFDTKETKKIIDIYRSER